MHLKFIFLLVAIFIGECFCAVKVELSGKFYNRIDFDS